MKFDFTKEFYPFVNNIVKAKELKKKYKALKVSITKKTILIKYYDSYLDGTNSIEMEKAIRDMDFIIP